MGEAVLRQGTRYAKKRIREHPARAVHKAEAQYIKARADYQFRMAAQENPELAKNAVTRYWHKQKLKRQYAKQARQAAKQTAKHGAKAAGKTAATTEKLAEQAVGFVKRHPVGVLIALACAVLVLSLQSCASSLVSLGNAAAGAVGATTYPAEDGDMLGPRPPTVHWRRSSSIIWIPTKAHTTMTSTILIWTLLSTTPMC